MRLWDLASGRERARLQGHENWVSSVAFSPDGRTLASVATTGQLIFWDVETGRELRTVETLNRRTTAVAFKPDGKVTAGNSAGLNDGATACILASAEAAAELNSASIPSAPWRRRWRWGRSF